MFIYVIYILIYKCLFLKKLTFIQETGKCRLFSNHLGLVVWKEVVKLLKLKLRIVREFIIIIIIIIIIIGYSV